MKTRGNRKTRNAVSKIYSIGTFGSLREIVLACASILKPPERLTVSQWAAKYRYVNNRGSYIGYWKNETAPYMVEPMDCLTSHVLDAVIMVAPAQCGKTDALLVNWTGFTIHGDPMDMLLINPTGNMARDFSKRRIDKLLRDTKECGDLLNTDRHADNILDKHFQNGVFLSLAHPSVSELAGRPVPRVGLTDYDRMPDDVGGDGAPFDLAQKRTTTFGSYRMTVAESSPSRPIEDPHWVETKGSHEAPPAKGIFALYNRGDRRRWYWLCPRCSQRFEGTFDMLRWNKQANNMVDIAESTYMECPHCKGRIEQSERHAMQQTGVWVKDGMFFDTAGELRGQSRKTRTASFWLRGVAAAFVSWGQLVTMFLTAEAEFDTTGSEDALVKFFNTDLAEPYVPKSMTAQRLPEHLKDRCLDLGERVVPHGVRCLIACVDVQKDRFEVQVHGIAPGRPFDITIIDRFAIRKSERLDDDGDPLFVRPSSYLDDWFLLETQVMNRRYPLADNSGREMGVALTVCDSGGAYDGKGGTATGMAYEFYRDLKKRGIAARFHLVKGASSPNAPRVSIHYPDAMRKDKFNAARGDIPVMMFNSNLLKDMLNNRLDCVDVGKGMISFPDWLPIDFFQELCVEVRKANGWKNVSGLRNESWDLLYYCLGAAHSPLMKIDRVDWQHPPAIFADWKDNPLVYGEVAKPEAKQDNSETKQPESLIEPKPAGESWDDLNKLYED